MTSTELYLLTQDPVHLDWAIKVRHACTNRTSLCVVMRVCVVLCCVEQRQEWTWLESTGMLNSQWLFNDGLLNDCQNNNSTTWTYKCVRVLPVHHNNRLAARA